MDSYDSGFYDSEIGKYHWPPFSKTSYDVVPYQASITCSDLDFHEPLSIEHYPTASYGVYSYSEFDEPTFLDPYPANTRDAYDSHYTHSEMNYSTYTFSEPKLITYDPIPCDNGYDSYCTHLEMNYSAYTFSEPKLITYDPIPCDNGYVLSQTQYLISYSTTNSEFNEPLFEEYDPTPYCGGYDPTLTYGKPLPPSDKICYPRSKPEPNDLPSENISHDAGDSETSRDNESEKIDGGVSEIPPNTIVKINDGENGNNNGQVGDALSIGKESSDGSDVGEPLESKQDEDRVVEYTYSDYGYDYPWSGYDYGNGKQVAEAVPYEYNSDTVDLCESIFGHWPCLARTRKQQRSNGSNEDAANGERNGNPWEGAAVYIFGDPWGQDQGKYYRGF